MVGMLKRADGHIGESRKMVGFQVILHPKESSSWPKREAP